MLTTKSALLTKITESLRKENEIIIDDVTIDMSGGQEAEVFHAEKIYLDENNIPMIELENGESFELQECDFSELLSIYEEVC